MTKLGAPPNTDGNGQWAWAIAGESSEKDNSQTTLGIQIARKLKVSQNYENRPFLVYRSDQRAAQRVAATVACNRVTSPVVGVFVAPCDMTFIVRIVSRCEQQTFVTDDVWYRAPSALYDVMPLSLWHDAERHGSSPRRRLKIGIKAKFHYSIQVVTSWNLAYHALSRSAASYHELAGLRPGRRPGLRPG